MALEDDLATAMADIAYERIVSSSAELTAMAGLIIEDEAERTALIEQIMATCKLLMNHLGIESDTPVSVLAERMGQRMGENPLYDLIHDSIEAVVGGGQSERPHD